MNSLLKLFVLFCGLSFVATVFYLLIKKRISEKNSIFWLSGAVIILILSAIPQLLEVVAGFIGIDYAPSLLFLLAILIIFIILMQQSIQISVLSDQVKELTQHVAIQNNKSQNIFGDNTINTTGSDMDNAY